MTTMTKIIKYSWLAIFLLFASSCDKGLEKININRTDPTSVDPVLLLNNAVLNSSFNTPTLLFDIAAVQQMITPTIFNYFSHGRHLKFNI